jgi:hypothetical protein
MERKEIDSQLVTVSSAWWNGDAAWCLESNGTHHVRRRTTTLWTTIWTSWRDVIVFWKVKIEARWRDAGGDEARLWLDALVIGSGACRRWRTMMHQ